MLVLKILKQLPRLHQVTKNPHTSPEINRKPSRKPKGYPCSFWAYPFFSVKNLTYPMGRQGYTGGMYILYMQQPENPQYPRKPPSGHIIGLCIPTIFLGIPQGVAVYLPTIQIYRLPGVYLCTLYTLYPILSIAILSQSTLFKNKT